MATSWALVQSDYAPNDSEIQAVSAEQGAKYIARAMRQINMTAWGDHYDDGVAYLAAHFGKSLAASGAVTAGAPGAVVSESVGSVSRTYASSGVSGADASYTTTVYGREYLRLRSLVSVGFMAI